MTTIQKIVLSLLLTASQSILAQSDDDLTVSTLDTLSSTLDTLSSTWDDTSDEDYLGGGVPATQPKKTKKALVIGIADYAHADKLIAPVNDARAMATLLRDNGWMVQGQENLKTKQSFELVVERFSQTLSAKDEVLIYYSGHGFQWNGRNYLVPQLAKIERASDINQQAYAMGNLIQMLNQKKCRVKVLLLDACRSNLNSRLKNIQTIKVGIKIIVRDIAPRPDASPSSNPTLTSGTLVAYATAPDSYALDGRKLSIFTEALHNVLSSNPCESLTDALQKTRQKVVTQTNNKQVPWENSSLTGKVTICTSR